MIMRVIRCVHDQILGFGPRAEPMLHPDPFAQWNIVRSALMVEAHTDTHAFFVRDPTSTRLLCIVTEGGGVMDGAADAALSG